jgi:hypothetical protein
MDYRLLLIKYISYVNWQEGVDFIYECSNEADKEKAGITEQEWEELQRLSEEAAKS